MENAITAGLSRQIVLARALEVTANNIANQNTSGFKAERVGFREYLARLDGAEAGDPYVSLVFDPDSYTDFSAGGVEATYAPLDFAIEGDGFFAVETDQGTFYTRDGRFSLDASGAVVTRSGARVLDQAGAPIVLDPELGDVALANDGALQQDGTVVATLGVFAFDDRRVLTKRGDNLFAAAAEPAAEPAPRIRQGYVETSNVVSIAAITDMVEIMRAYEQAASLIETSNQLARDAIRTLSEPA